MNEETIFLQIHAALDRIERERDVRILDACESGSRAWGFASHDSDYDVRSLYLHPRDWYLSIDDRRDVIERPISDDLDLSGWDLRKALRLLCKSNPALLEWLRLPIVYRENPPFAAEFRALAEKFYSPKRCFVHYLHMAEGNARDYLRGRSQVSLKKYFYVFRPLLACRWIERQLGPVPMRFDQLIETVMGEDEVCVTLEELVARKKSGDELAVAPAVEVLSDFIDIELARLVALSEPDETATDVTDLNEFFRRQVV